MFFLLWEVLMNHIFHKLIYVRLQVPIQSFLTIENDKYSHQ